MTSAAPRAEDFYNLFCLLLREKRTKYLAILSVNHPFRREIAEGIEKTRLQNSVELTLIASQETEALSQVRDIYKTGPHFDAVLFFSLMPGTYEFIAKQENPKECRFVLDQFSLYQNIRFTGYAYTTDLEHAAGLVIDNLLEQLEGSEEKRFIRMEFSVNQYENGTFLKQIKQGDFK